MGYHAIPWYTMGYPIRKENRYIVVAESFRWPCALCSSDDHLELDLATADPQSQRARGLSRSQWRLDSRASHFLDLND